MDKLGKIRQLRWKLICWKLCKRRYSSLKFRNFTDVCQPRTQSAFPWLLPTSKASEKRPGDEVGRGWTFANGEGNKFSQTCRGYIFAHLRRIPFKIGKFTNIKALFQWCRWIFLLPGPGQLVAEGSLLYPFQDFICKGIVTQEKYIHFKLSAWLNKYGIV